MNRRDFLHRLGGAAALVSLSPLLDLSEIIPAPSVAATVSGINLEELNAITIKCLMPGFTDQFFRASPLLTYLETHGVA